MINQTVLFLPQTDCTNERLKPYANSLGASVFFDQDSHFGTPLKKIFNNVIRFEIGEYYVRNGVIETNKRIIEIVHEHSAKYVFWPTRTYELLEETFTKIRKQGAFVIGWFFDDEFRFDNYSRWWIPYMDFIFTADKASVNRYCQLGIKAIHMPVTGEPEYFVSKHSEKTYDVSFIGSRYIADRDVFVQNLSDHGVSISTFGKGWKNGFVSHDEMVQIFCNSKINLCFTKSYDGNRSQLKGKIFDITMSGGFLLCEYVEEIEDFFEIDKELVCFKNLNEAIEKIDYFLKHDNERSTIAAAGKKKVIDRYAQSVLFENAFNLIESQTRNHVSRGVVKMNTKYHMPKHILLEHAQFHIRWALVLKKTGFKRKFWKGELSLACKYSLIYSTIQFYMPILFNVLLFFRNGFIRIREKSLLYLSFQKFKSGK